MNEKTIYWLSAIGFGVLLGVYVFNRPKTRQEKIDFLNKYVKPAGYSQWDLADLNIMYEISRRDHLGNEPNEQEKETIKKLLDKYAQFINVGTPLELQQQVLHNN